MPTYPGDDGAAPGYTGPGYTPDPIMEPPSAPPAAGYASDAIDAGSPGHPTMNTAAGMSLGAALLNLSVEENKPQLGGGLGLFARQQRDIERLKLRVGALEQTS